MIFPNKIPTYDLSATSNGSSEDLELLIDFKLPSKHQYVYNLRHSISVGFIIYAKETVYE